MHQAVYGELTFEKHDVVNEEKERPAYENHGNDKAIHEIERSVHIEYETPDEIHGAVKPYRLDGRRQPAVDFEFYLERVEKRVKPEKHDERQHIPYVEARKEQGEQRGADIGEHIAPPAIFGKRNHQREARQKIARKQQSTGKSSHRQRYRGQSAGHGGECNLVCGNFLHRLKTEKRLICNRSRG